MKKQDAILFYKNQIESAKLMKEGARQLEANATRLESEAKSALELLGNNPERTRKGKYQLSDEIIFSLSASLTK